MDRPETQYARTPDGVHIAYQVAGNGPPDLVYLSSWDLAIDLHWDEPRQVQFFERLASFGRLIMFDKRGSGASDSVSLAAMPTLESWVDDVRFVMDEVGSERAAIVAPTFTGPLGCLVAATLPERTSALVLLDTFARWRSADDYPGMDPALVSSMLDGLEDGWGAPSGGALGFYAPSLMASEATRHWWARCQRLSIGPAAAVAFTTMMVNSDVRDVLPAIQAPTLVMSNNDLLRAWGRYLAERIPGAVLVATGGTDVLPWLADGVADQLQEFLTGTRAAPEMDRALATVLFTDIVASTEHASRMGDKKWTDVLARHDLLIARELERYRGRRVNPTGDGILAAFDGPARAVRCAQAIAEGVRSLGIEIRAGLHTGEVELRGEDIGGIAVHIGHRVSGLAAPGEVLVSRTVTDLVAGSGLSFEDRGERELKGVPGSWRLFAVVG